MKCATASLYRSALIYLIQLHLPALSEQNLNCLLLPHILSLFGGFWHAGLGAAVGGASIWWNFFLLLLNWTMTRSESFNLSFYPEKKSNCILSSFIWLASMSILGSLFHMLIPPFPWKNSSERMLRFHSFFRWRLLFKSPYWAEQFLWFSFIRLHNFSTSVCDSLISSNEHNGSCPSLAI